MSLKDPEVDRLAKAVASLTGESLVSAVRTALKERLERETRRRQPNARLAEQLVALGQADQDGRTADEIIGYGPDGLW